MPLSLNKPQGDFLAAKKKFNAFVGGYRSGKTFVGCVRLWSLAVSYPGIKLGYFAPTYPMIQDIFYSTIEEVGALLSEEWGVSLTVDINVGRKEVKLIINGQEYAMVKCRAMEHAHRIVGFDISHAQIDEIDTMKMNKADAAWKKIIARMSSVRDDYPANTVDFTTTPEGFNFVYDLFIVQLKKNPKIASDYSITKASTRLNAKNLPSDYIQSLYNTYPSNLVDAYVDGEFVNLTGGTIYNQYTDANLSNEIVTESDHTLHVGMDFNVQKMAARVFVKRGNNEHIVDEFNELYDTTDMIENIKLRYPNKKIVVYPDASGNNRKSNSADTTDIALLRQAGFTVKAPEANPRVKTRINSVNAMFCNANGERRLYVNKNKCPVTHDELTQQVYDDKGDPDKKGGKDHGNDALGYYISYTYPILKPFSKPMMMV
ncbi:terminase large subunit domain-containing protein [Vibrio casei]|uniref:terminase large subunit domain-containing protein n=1 Tax=Vibrio casei TaxID=673372 RepID=UPI003F96BD1B